MGLCALDFLSVLPRYPQSNTKSDVSEARIQGGGPVPTAVFALARYGWKTAFTGVVGDDWGGDIIMQGLTAGGVDVSRILRDPESRTAHAFIWVDGPSGDRAVALDRTRIRNLSAQQVPIEWIQDSRILLCDGRETEAQLAALGAARESDTVTVFDASSRRDRMEEILALVDYPVVSRDFIPDVFGVENPVMGLDRLLKYGAKGAVITVGEEGCLWKTADGDKGVEAGYVVGVKDTTGAGDLFHAGFIHGLLSGWDIDKCCRFGCAAAALKCQALGGQPGVTDVSHVMHFMETARRRVVQKAQYPK